MARINDLFVNSDRHDAREKLAYITSLTGSAFEIDRQLSLAMLAYMEQDRPAAVVELSGYTAAEMEMN